MNTTRAAGWRMRIFSASSFPCICGMITSVSSTSMRSSAASSYVCPVDDAAESFVVGVVVAPDDVAADHAGLLLVAGVVGAVEREVPQRGELGLDAVQPGRIRRGVGDLDIIRGCPLSDALVFTGGQVG